MLFWKLLKLRSRNPTTRWRAARELGRLGNVSALNPLAAALKDPDSDVREAAANSLGQIGDARAVGPLIAVLKASDITLQKEAAVALGRIGDAQAVEPLVDMLKDENAEVRRAAVDALGEIGDHRALIALQLTLGSDSSADVRMQAAYALGKVKDPSSVGLLVECFSDLYPGLEGAVMDTLGKLGDPQACGPLIRRLKHGGDLSRKWAALTLAEISADAQVVDALIEALGDYHWGVRYSVGKALHQIGDPAIGPLAAALKRDMPKGVNERQFFEEALRNTFPNTGFAFDPNLNERQLLKEALRKIARDA